MGALGIYKFFRAGRSAGGLRVAGGGEDVPESYPRLSTETCHFYAKLLVIFA